jgi:KaiC/GvpD/RAD55 family RecA-like ATPase
MHATKSALSLTSESASSLSRIIGIIAAVLLIFSITFPPFAGDLTLATAIQPSFLQLLQATIGSRYPDATTIVSVVGFILLVLGLFLDLVFLGVRGGARRVRAGLLTCATGLLLLTGTLFDYSGDVSSKILTVIYVGVWPSLRLYGIAYFMAWLAIITALFATSRTVAGRTGRQQTAAVASQTAQVVQNLIPTGYVALDNMLLGGLFPGSSIVLTGPPCDEKNMIVRRFIESTVTTGRGCIYISSSIDRVRDLLSSHGRYLHVVLCHPQAETIATEYPEIARLRTVDNLTEINLQFTKAVAKLSSNKPTVLCLEILDDVLLDHHSATRRWLMDILGRSKSSDMTCLATLNPAMHTDVESQAMLETFDGHIDLYEAELHVHPKLIRVKKFGGRKYLDNELLVDKEKI